MTHELKTWPEYFEEVWNGNKTFELRKNDRKFEAGDILVLREYDPASGTYLRETIRHVDYVLNGPCFGLEEGYCIMSIAP